MLQNFIKKIVRHKIIVGLGIIVLVGTGYFMYKKANSGVGGISYVLAAVEKGTIVTSVSGSGQVVAENQLSVKSQASGKVIYVSAENNQQVRAGTFLIKLDTTDAETAIEDASSNLADAQLALAKLNGLETESGKIRGTKEKLEDSLESYYRNGFNDVSNVFLQLPDIMSELQDIIISNSFNSSQWNLDFYADAIKMHDINAWQYKNDVYDKYQITIAAYDKNFQDYKSASRFSDEGTIESLINETYETIRDISDTVKSMDDLILLYRDLQARAGSKPLALASTHLTTLNGYIGTTNNYLSSLLSDINNIQNGKESLIEADFTIADQEKQVEKMQKALDDAKSKLADYSIYSPSAGTITAMSLKVGDTISANSSIATLVSSQQIAEITLNEVDAAKVKVGQKVNVTFDAVSDLNITGKVADIDTLGTVTQGVVNYTVKISFDTQDERVKPGMSVTADIITDAKSDVLTIPNSAIKSQGSQKYVELAEGQINGGQQLLANVSASALKSPLQQQTVETGLSNDTYTEVVSGLKEGDIIVSSTISSNNTNTGGSTQTQSNELRIPGISNFGGGR